MRPNINALCVTAWGALLEFKGWHHNSADLHAPTLAHIADPYAIDSGMYIDAREIVLIARKKTYAL
jgi:hypothetical protein